LFPALQADELDLNVFAHAVTAELDHLPGQINDLYWLAHIEHEDFPAGTLNSALKHQADRFGNCHEIAGYIRVRHGHGSALGDLLLENGDHTAGGTEHVAEAHRDKLGAVTGA